MGFAASGVYAAVGALMLTPDDVHWHEMSRHGRRARAAAVGVALAVPVLLVFGGLLMSADPGFERIVRSLVPWNVTTIASHVLLAGFIAWTSAGYLRTLSTAKDPVLEFGSTTLAKAPRNPALGILELGIPLGALSLIFLVFLGLQARYMFGGKAVILETAGLTYAEYARGGFFELVTLATLLLPVLLGTEWLLEQHNPRAVTGFRTLSATLLVLIGLIMLSAVLRMRLYMDAYGLTQDRFYAMAFMIWIGVVLALFGATVLRGMRNRFAFWAVTTGFATLAVLNIMNPDAVIARTNLSRAEAGTEFDLEYAARLHADAIPELIARAPALLSSQQCDLFWNAIDRWTPRKAADWRTWNLSRAKARQLSGIRTGSLLSCGDPQPGHRSGSASLAGAIGPVGRLVSTCRKNARRSYCLRWGISCLVTCSSRRSARLWPTVVHPRAPASKQRSGPASKQRSGTNGLDYSWRDRARARCHSGRRRPCAKIGLGTRGGDPRNRHLGYRPRRTHVRIGDRLRLSTLRAARSWRHSLQARGGRRRWT